MRKNTWQMRNEGHQCIIMVWQNGWIVKVYWRYWHGLWLCLHGTGSKLIQMDPVRKLDRIGLLFTRDRSGTGLEWIQTDPKLDLLFYRSNFGSILDWFQSGPVYTEAGLVRFRTVPVRSRVNIALGLWNNRRAVLPRFDINDIFYFIHVSTRGPPRI